MYWQIAIGILLARMIEFFTLSLITAIIKTVRESFSKSSMVENGGQ